MPTYVLPQVLVFQDFQQVPSAQRLPLRAHISGPHAFLIRFAESDEQADGQLGFYDFQIGHTGDDGFVIPNRPAGATVDASYTKLWAKNAILKYFTHGASLSGQGDVNTVTNAANRVQATVINWRTNGAYARHSSLYDRDVQVGDVAKVRALPVGEDPVTLWTKVTGFKGDDVAATIGDPSLDTDNEEVQVQSESVEQTVGPFNCLSAVADGTTYDGLVDGDVTETYRIIVIGASTASDLTTAELRVISASGNDDVASVTPAANGSPTAIGTRGLTVTFTDTDAAACSDSASEQGVTADDLIIGQEWEAVVTMDFTPPTTASNALDTDYTGAWDTTYVVEVSRGGLFAATNKPQISVTTTTGVDISGPTNVTAAATNVAVGSAGVTISFSGITGLRKGDRFYIVVTSVVEGPMRTLILANDLPSSVPGGTECDVTLYILKPALEISANSLTPPTKNWTATATDIDVIAGITVNDSTWTDGGTLLPLPLESNVANEYGELFIEYRAWQSTFCTTIGTISDTANINDISGALHPDNPLKWGVFKALENSNGVAVKYTAVCNPDDSTSWADVLELTLGRDDVYGLVPLTRDPVVIGLYTAHIAAQSTPEQGLWRALWVSLIGKSEIPLVHAGSTVVGHTTATTTNGTVALATILDDPDTAGTQYTLVNVPAMNANFITNGVVPGDIVRAEYEGDGFGTLTYSEYVVDAVVSEDQIRLLTGPDAAINIPSKIEVWRNLTATQEAAEIAQDAGAYSNRRVRAVWPDQIESSGTVMEGYHLAAALAGLRSGVVPQQGMTNLAISGFTDVSRTAERFNRAQLDSMAVAGAWIVTQDPLDGEVYTRHAVTTDDYEDINLREEQVSSNVDSISYRFKDFFEPYIGVWNVTPTLLTQLAVDIGTLIDELREERPSDRVGGQLINATIVDLRPHAILLDRVVLELDLNLPIPFNNFEIHLLV